MGGPSCLKTSNKSRKQHIRVTWQGARAKVYTNYQLQLDMPATQTITFIDEKVTKVIQPHDDVVMLNLQIANHNVHQVLIDTRSSVDVLFCLAYSQMELLSMVLKPPNTLLYKFASCKVQPFRGVKLLITTSSHPTQATVLTNILVVDAPFVHNVIIGQPILNALRVVALTYHLALKFPTLAEVGISKGIKLKLTATMSWL